jgi:alkylation response protein AidB-like acyl-CoA dehydrogenase
MPLTLSDDQLLLKDTARQFLDEKSPVTRMRELRDTEDPTGFSRALWKEMAEMGWLGIPFPEELGGAGMGFGELAVVMEECGRVLAPEPFLSTLLLGGQAVLHGADDPLKSEVIAAVCSGDRVLAMALQERGRFDPCDVKSRAERQGDGFRLTGEKQFVLDAHVADQQIHLSARSVAPGAGK